MRKSPRPKHVRSSRDIGGALSHQTTGKTCPGSHSMIRNRGLSLINRFGLRVGRSMVHLIYNKVLHTAWRCMRQATWCSPCSGYAYLVHRLSPHPSLIRQHLAMTMPSAVRRSARGLALAYRLVP